MYSASLCVKEIHYLNLSYLLLIQRISNCDEPAIFSGIDAELALVLQKLSLSKLVALAKTNQLLLTLRPEIIVQKLGVPTT
ncbi:flagellar transcriptional regulator FlhD [Lelliottia amnigena]